MQVSTSRLIYKIHVFVHLVGMCVDLQRGFHLRSSTLKARRGSLCAGVVDTNVSLKRGVYSGVMHEKPSIRQASGTALAG
jgi:hypothetical protein